MERLGRKEREVQAGCWYVNGCSARCISYWSRFSGSHRLKRFLVEFDETPESRCSGETLIARHSCGVYVWGSSSHGHTRGQLNLVTGFSFTKSGSLFQSRGVLLQK